MMSRTRTCQGLACNGDPSEDTACDQANAAACTPIGKQNADGDITLMYIGIDNCVGIQVSNEIINIWIIDWENL